MIVFHCCSALGLSLLSSFLTIQAQAGSWQTELVAGNGASGHSGDGGLALKAELNQPFGLVRGPDGYLYFCEMAGNVVRRIDSHGAIHTVAGSGVKGSEGDGGPALKAQFNMPHEIRFDKAGNLYVADMSNHRIRKIDFDTRLITTVAGSGTAGFSGDGGPASKAELNQPLGIQFDPRGDLYICDVGNNRVRKMNLKTGVITTIAGNGQSGATPDGANFKNVPLNTPRALAFDEVGNLWLATREGNQVFRLDLAKDIVHHVAGTGKQGSTGDDGPAKRATFKGIKGLYLADTENHTIRMIDIATGTVQRLCGTGDPGDGPDGDALRCKLNNPHGMFIDADGSIFVGDSQNNRIRRIRWVQ
jgi:DNA-binding beta-propeller fold protein YncE